MSVEKSDHFGKYGFENYKHPDKFGDWLGYEVIHIDKALYKAEVQLNVREDHLSSAGRVHGGVVSAFFDFACGAAVFSSLGPKDFCSTVELKVNYMRPIELGDVLVAKSEVVFRGKRLCVLHAYAYRNGTSEPVAMATATFNVVTVRE
jgi:uncharacterized protein (TIGR00369 family)